jgi:hypothetical protein
MVKARRAVSTGLAATIIAAVLAVTPQPAHAAGTFVMYDNTSYTSATIGNGAVTSNLVPNSTCGPLVANGAMPTQAQLQSIVQADDTNPEGALVLDCESLYLTGSASTAATHYQDLLQLQQWARAVEPDQVIGWYGLLGNTSSSYYSYYQDLIAAAPAINSTVPIYPYVWPQYHQGSSPSTLSLTFIPAAQWSEELATIQEEHLAGVVVWGGSSTSGTCDATCESTAGNQGWLPATQQFLNYVANPQTDLALGKTATVSSVNVSGRGGPQSASTVTP